MPETKRDEGPKALKEACELLKDVQFFCAEGETKTRATLHLAPSEISNRCTRALMTLNKLASAPQSRDAQKLIETVRKTLNFWVPNYDAEAKNDALEALAQLESALGEKTVPLAMLNEIDDFGRADSYQSSGEWEGKCQEIVSKHMPGYTVK
jgi:hypothetical protein